jgi:hypothetical protein
MDEADFGKYKKCKCCGILYLKLLNNGVCLSCVETGLYDYTRIRDYIREHPKVTLAEVSRALKIGVSAIVRFIDEGRLEIVKNSNELYIPIDKFE